MGDTSAGDRLSRVKESLKASAIETAQEQYGLLDATSEGRWLVVVGVTADGTRIPAEHPTGLQGVPGGSISGIDVHMEPDGGATCAYTLREDVTLEQTVAQIEAAFAAWTQSEQVED